MDSVEVVAVVAEQRGLNPEKFLKGFGILRSERYLGGETRELIKRFVEIESERRVLPVPPMASSVLNCNWCKKRIRLDFKTWQTEW